MRDPYPDHLPDVPARELPGQAPLFASPTIPGPPHPRSDDAPTTAAGEGGPPLPPGRLDSPTRGDTDPADSGGLPGLLERLAKVLSMHRIDDWYAGGIERAWIAVGPSEMNGPPLFIRDRDITTVHGVRWLDLPGVPGIEAETDATRAAEMALAVLERT